MDIYKKHWNFMRSRKLARRKKKEEVSISFHYLKRENKENGTDDPFTEEEFAKLYDKLVELKKADLTDDTIKDKLRFKMQAAIDDIELHNKKTICGIYKGGYSGHAYENTDKGTIPADSISLRPFFFLLYLSDSGSIYIATQYIGNFGSYMAIKNTILSCLTNTSGVSSQTFNCTNYLLDKTLAKEVEIVVSKPATAINANNIFNRSVAISVKKQSKDDGFEKQVEDEILKHTGKSPGEMKKILANLIPDELMEINDEDIEDCTILAKVNGSPKTIRILDESNYASRFPVNVPMKSNGHPEYSPLKIEALKLLETRIISRKANV